MPECEGQLLGLSAQTLHCIPTWPKGPKKWRMWKNVHSSPHTISTLFQNLLMASDIWWSDGLWPFTFHSWRLSKFYPYWPLEHQKPMYPVASAFTITNIKAPYAWTKAQHQHCYTWAPCPCFPKIHWDTAHSVPLGPSTRTQVIFPVPAQFREGKVGHCIC